MVGVLETQKRMRFSISWYVKTMIAVASDWPMWNEFPDSVSLVFGVGIQADIHAGSPNSSFPDHMGIYSE